MSGRPRKGRPVAFAPITPERSQPDPVLGLKFTIDNARKDLRYYTHFAESLPVSAVVGEAVHQSLVNASLLGFGDKYVASLIEAQEKLNGVAIVPKG